MKNPLTVVMNSDFDVPADDICVTVPYSSGLSKAHMIFAYNDGSLIFQGEIDELVNVAGSGRAITKITARSLAGRLLDNEAEPVTYKNPASEFIFNRHLKPFGITGCDGDEVPFFGNLKIEKGMTHWQVLESFCRNRYSSKPRITGDGRAVLCGQENAEVVKFGRGGISYISIKEHKKPFRLISEVRLRLNEYGEYSGRIKNENPDCRGIERVRYVNAAADNTNVQTADRMIENSNKDSYSLVLECTGCHLDVLGKSAVVCDSLLGYIENLSAVRVRYALGRDGETTTVILQAA